MKESREKRSARVFPPGYIGPRTQYEKATRGAPCSRQAPARGRSPQTNYLPHSLSRAQTDGRSARRPTPCSVSALRASVAADRPHATHYTLTGGARRPPAHSLYCHPGRGRGRRPPKISSSVHHTRTHKHTRTRRRDKILCAHTHTPGGAERRVLSLSGRGRPGPCAAAADWDAARRAALAD